MVAIPTITVPIAAHLAAFGPASLLAVGLVTNPRALTVTDNKI
jgi:hypothetical protein